MIIFDYEYTHGRLILKKSPLPPQRVAGLHPTGNQNFAGEESRTNSVRKKNMCGLTGRYGILACLVFSGTQAVFDRKMQGLPSARFLFPTQ